MSGYCVYVVRLRKVQREPHACGMSHYTHELGLGQPNHNMSVAGPADVLVYLNKLGLRLLLWVNRGTELEV